MLLTLILFLLVIVCVTPISFLSHISSFKETLGTVVGRDTKMFTVMADQITPFILMLFNY